MAKQSVTIHYRLPGNGPDDFGPDVEMTWARTGGELMYFAIGGIDYTENGEALSKVIEKIGEERLVHLINTAFEKQDLEEERGTR